ncbi:hypothetical protein MMC26_000688 [Xylographa opegraphella]|nr:hypothetical protein [Xylographa opegraphella]
MAHSAPDLHIPSTDSIVQVSIIDTTTHIGAIPNGLFMVPNIPGYEYLNCPSYSFLIEHSSGRKILFDLGIRKDWENLAPKVFYRLRDSKWDIRASKDVREILEDEGFDPGTIDGIIWSHFHFDHLGDPSRFSEKADLIVGPGFKEAFMPGYPEDLEGSIRVSDYEFVHPRRSGRNIFEINFSAKPLKIGDFPAYDFFGDGSFYLLDSPGHTVAHLCGLARTTTGPGGDTFILMGGDFAHHGGEFRPSPYLPLPTSIQPHPFKNMRGHSPSCPGSIFEKVHPAITQKRDGGDGKWMTEPFFRPGLETTHDLEQCVNTIKKVQEADGHEQVLVIFAHDEALVDVVEFFPKKANEWLKKGWGANTKWMFLKDFQKAVEAPVI